MPRLSFCCLFVIIVACNNKSTFDDNIKINRSNCVSEIVYYNSTPSHKFDTLVDCQCWKPNYYITYIDIYKNNGFSFNNLRIIYIDNSFEAKYELWYDMAGQEVITKAKKIHIQLNKYNYKIGDTLIGLIDFTGNNTIWYLNDLPVKMKIRGAFKCIVNQTNSEYIIRRKDEIPVTKY